MEILKAKLNFNKILSDAQVDDVSHNINRILEKVLGCDIVQILSLDTISDADYNLALDMVKRRATGYPLQYILGETEFFGNIILVEPNVLIPRNETEQLCEIVSKVSDGKSVLDLCCGSGCIGLGIKKNSNSQVTLSDISDYAIATTQKNAKLNNLDVSVIKSNLFENISGKFDIIVSNPPYIKTDDLKGLQREVLFEPTLALDGKLDGLYFYKEIIFKSVKYLNRCGLIYFECGNTQAESIAKLLSKDFECIKIIKDYYNKERFVSARLKDNVC